MSFPSHVEFELTNNCQLSCIMCPHTIMKRQRGYMLWETFKKAVDECKGFVKTSYLHQIGEPLIHPQIIKMIDYAANAGIRTSISTNCLLLDAEMSDRILKSKLTEITLCLDSLNQVVYEKIRVGSNFYKVIKNIEIFLLKKMESKSKIWVQLQMIKMKENQDEWNSFRNFDKASVDEILVKPYSTFAGNVVKEEAENKYRLTCKKSFGCLTIQWNGDMVICCRDFDGVTKIGNILTDKIVDIWNGQKYREIRQAFIDKDYDKLPFCRSC